MDKKTIVTIILMLIGLGLIQYDGGKNSFYLGLGLGTVVMVSVWAIIRIIQEYKK